MRIRKHAWVEKELDECGFFVKNPIENKNKWREYFKNNNPIHIELGCGKGNFISKLASSNPNINYIAIDLISEMLGRAKRTIEEEYNKESKKIENLAIMSYDIELIDNILGEEDKIDRIYINFCNPWPKARHNKKRLTHTKQLEKYKTFLNEKAEIYFKTDDDNLFLASQRYFKEAGFDITNITYDLHSISDIENIETEHEKMFTAQGIKIKALIARKT